MPGSARSVNCHNDDEGRRTVGKVLVGGLLAGIVVFFWGAIAHMALPIGTMGIRPIPDEGKIVAALKDSIREPGFYVVPGRDMNKSMSKSEEDAYTAKVRQGPSG